MRRGAAALVAFAAVASAAPNSLGFESETLPDDFLHERHGRFLAENDDPTVPRNESMARALQTTCYRAGWKYGFSDWTCAQGYRMPLSNEFNLVSPCIAASDYSRFSYYNDIAAQGTGSQCNCKWNNKWCYYPSIPSMRQGLLCGDFSSLHICVVRCNTSPPSPAANTVMTWVNGAAVRYSCASGYYETSSYQGYAATWTCALTWTGSSQPVCSRCPTGSYCYSGYKWSCRAGRFGGVLGLTSSTCSGTCAEGFWCSAGSTTATQNQCGGTGAFYCPAGSTGPRVAPYGTYTTPLTAPVTQRSGYLPCPPGRSCDNGLIMPLVDFSTICSTPLPALLTEAAAGLDVGPRIVPITPGCPSCTVGYGLAVLSADPTCNASAVAAALVVNTTTGRLRTTSPSILYSKCPGGFAVDVMAVRRDSTGSFVPPTPGCSSVSTQLSSTNWVANGGFEAGELYWTVSRGNINLKGPGGCCFRDWRCPGDSRACIDINGESPGIIQQTIRSLPANARFNFSMSVNGNWNGASQPVHSVDVVFGSATVCSLSYTRPPNWSPGTVHRTSQKRWCTVNTTTGGDVVLKIVSTSLVSPVAGMVIDDVQLEGPLAAQPCAVCRLNVAVAQVARTPVITSCSSAGATERSDIGTPVAANLSAINPNIGTTLVWSINSTSSPFAISGCDGKLTVTRFISFADQTSFSIPIVVSNIGLSPTLTATCNLTVPIRQLRLPPVFSTTTFKLPEDSQNGTVVGNVGAAAQADGTLVDRVWFTANDSRHCFEVDANGNITLARPLPAMVVQSSFTYQVTASTTAGMVATATITIVLSTVPQKPTTYPQFRTVSEAVAPGTVLGAPLVASHPQSVPINFTALGDPTGNDIPFAMDEDGVVTFQPTVNATLDFTLRKDYSLEFTVTDALGLTATSTLTIALTQINKPPVWLSGGFFQVLMDEYAAPGTQVHQLVSSGNTPLKMPVFVSAYNLQETLGMAYTIVAVQPPQAAAFLAIDGLSGAITLSYNAPGAFRYEPSWSYAHGNAIMINVSATNTGLPPLSSYSLVELNVSAIRPRIQPASYVIPGNYASDQLLGTVSAWTFAPGVPLNFTIVSNDADAAGRPAFVLGRTSGNLSLATGVAFDFSVKNSFQLLVCVTDAAGLNATAPISVTLAHVNRPPTWRPVPRLFARALTAGDVGQALAAYVTDPDVALGVGEALTFTFAGTAPSNGNSDNTFAITNTTGQIFASNLTAAAFQYPAQATVAPTFNITVVVTDAGVDGPAASASTIITIELTANRIPPTVSYVNVSVPELSGPGTVVGTVVGATVNVGYRLTYAIAPAGDNAYEPFPFTITTVDDGIANAGRIGTTSATALETSKRSRYQATVTVTDNNPTSPLSASAPVDIYVTWVPRPPFFNRATRQAASVRYQFSVDEHAAAGALVSGSAVAASSKDSWLQASLQYSLAGVSAGLLAINPTSGAISTGAGWAAVDYATTKDVNATVVVTDSLGLTDTAAVRVVVLEINKPAVFSALRNAANVTAAALTVREDAPVGTHIGYVTAVDPNGRSVWASKRYSVAAAGASSFFGIHQDTGAMYVAAPGMDWWDQPTFNVTVSVQDSDPFVPIVVSTTVTVTLIQVNTVSIAGFFVDAAADMFTAANISTAVSNVLQAEFTTNGTAAARLLYVRGTGFGRSARRLATEGATVADTNVTAMFGEGQFAADCVVVQANTLLACAVPEGAGGMHRWTVTIDGRWTATSTMMTRYMAPTIASVNKLDVSAAAPWADHAISTAGIDSLLITGTNLGAAGTIVYLAYGRESLQGFETNFAAAASCVFVVPQTAVACPAVPGVGAQLKFAVQVAQQASPAYVFSPVHYSPPTITAVFAATLSTLGGTAIVVNGTNFPAARGDDGSVVLEYARDLDGTGAALYRTTCAVTVPLVQVTCEAAPGVGLGLDVRVGVAGQWSLPVPGALSYARPVVTGITGAGRLNAATTGGQEITIAGAAFGPASPLFPNGTAIPSDMLPRVLLVDRGNNRTQERVFEARNCFVVSDSSLSCLTPPGAGKGLQLVVMIGGAVSAPSTNTTVAYSAPVVSMYETESPDVSTTALATRGGDVVLVRGLGFGPGPEGLEQVTYTTDDNQQSFMANCTWQSDAALRCITAPGAGSGLRWYVRVAGQSSVNPSTSYAPPIIDSFSGTTADAAVEGGDRVVLNGRYLGLPAHLGAVTFGPSASEFTAACVMTIPHSQLDCTLPPGIGRNLRWQVTVGRQTSKPSTATTSYATPLLINITPSALPTSARNAAGDIYITIHGVDLAFRSLTLPLTVRVSTNNLAPPPQYLFDLHWASIAAGGSGNTVVLTFLSQCAVVTPVAISASPAPGSSMAETVRNNKVRKLHNIVFKAPEGSGQNAAVFVMAGNTVMSNILFIEYAAPKITSVAAERKNVPVGYYRITVEGSSFCNGQNGCGYVLVNDMQATPISWSHTLVEVIAPMKAGTDTDGSVRIIAGRRTSNVFVFDRPAPAVSSIVAQGQWTGMSTAGGEQFFVRGVYDVDATVNNSVSITIGGRPCSDQWGYVDNGANDTASASYTLVCRTPPGVGQSLPIIIKYMNATSRTDASLVFTYGAPRLDAVTILAPVEDAASAAAVSNMSTLQTRLPGGNAFVGGTTAAGGIPTLGAAVRISGANLADSSIAAAALEDPAGMAILQLLDYRHTAAVAVIPPGDGTSHALRYSVGGQVSQMLAFRYAPPTVTSMQPNHGPAAGGTLLTLRGSNFGVSRPVITIGGQPCQVAEPFAPHPTHSAVTCVVPRGVGTNWPIQLTVGDQSTTPATLRWSYDAPVVAAISPASGPTSGAWPGAVAADGVQTAGARIVQVVAGINFGTSGTVALVPTGRGDVASTNLTVPAADIISWNDSTIVFYMPAGYGDRLGLQVTTAGQRSAIDVEFSYDAPAITSIARLDRSAALCQPVEQCFQYGNSSLCRPVSAGCYDTRGGYLLQVLGTSLWPANTLVTVGGRPCNKPAEPALQALMSPYMLICRVPAHTGEDLPVLATVGAARTSQVTNATRFSYDPPSVSVISPNFASALGSETITIRGKGYGMTPTALSIAINGVPCDASAWVSDSVLKCTLPAGVVGGKNVSISVANRAQPLVLYGIEEQLNYRCPSGYYGRQGQQCKPCKRGASCPGGDVATQAVVASKGFWMRAPPSAVVTTGRMLTVTAEDDLEFLPCNPPDACLPGNECAEGYTGDRCSQCVPGAHYRVGVRCVSCPSNAKATTAAIFAVLAVVVAVARMLDRAGVTLASAAVLVDFAQVISTAGLTKLAWVPSMSMLLRALTAFSLSLDLTSPECVNPSLSWRDKFFIIQAIPLVVLAVLAAVYLLRFGYRVACLPRTSTKNRLPTIYASVSAFVGFMRVYYLYSAKTSFDAVNCTTVGDAAYLNGMAMPEYACWTAGSQQAALFTLGVGTLLFYAGVLPLAVFGLLWYQQETVHVDQLLRIQDVPRPSTANFRRAFSKLYSRYMPGKWWFEVCVTLRKLFVASAIAMASRQTPAYQMAALLVTFAVSYAIHIVHWPLLTPSRRAEALAVHEALAATNPMQTRVAEAIRTGRRSSTKAEALQPAVATISKPPAGNVPLLVRIVDLNLVEAVMLACCCAVALAGIVLDSQRFQDANMDVPDVRREYNAWAFGSMACICGALAYGVFSILAEVASSTELRRAVCGGGARTVSASKPRTVAVSTAVDRRRSVMLDSGDVTVTMASPLSRDDSGADVPSMVDGTATTPTGEKRHSLMERLQSSNRQVSAGKPSASLKTTSRHVPAPPVPVGVRGQDKPHGGGGSSNSSVISATPPHRRPIGASHASPVAFSARRLGVSTGSSEPTSPPSPGSPGSTGTSSRTIARVAPGTAEASIIAGMRGGGYKARVLHGAHHAPSPPVAAAAPDSGSSAVTGDSRA